MQYLLHIHRWRQSIYYIHVRTWIKITRLFWSHHHDRLLSKHQLCRFNLSILSEQLLSQIKDLTVYYMLAFFQTPNSQRILVIAFDSCIGFDHWRRFYIYPIKDYIYPIIDVIYPIIDFIHIYIYVYPCIRFAHHWHPSRWLARRSGCPWLGMDPGTSQGDKFHWIGLREKN